MSAFPRQDIIQAKSPELQLCINVTSGGECNILLRTDIGGGAEFRTVQGVVENDPKLRSRTCVVKVL
jgi:hypothetical protein